MSWPVDTAKLERVRELMHERDLEAFVVRSPDNVLYLTNYWPMKGYEMVVFPRTGDPVLVVMEPQEEEARRTAWTGDVRTFAFYDPRDPRPPTARAFDVCADALREFDFTGAVGAELTQGTQGSDRMVGEPTAWSKSFFDGVAEASRRMVDGTMVLAEARMIKTEQEVERMRLANELARLGLEHVRDQIRVGMPAGQVAALFEAHVHGIGTGYHGKVEMARAFTLVWSGQDIRIFAPTGSAPVVEGEPTLMEIWVCADGYWTDLTKNLCIGRPKPAYERLLELLLVTLDEAATHVRDGASLPQLDRLIRARIAEAGYTEPPHPLAHGVGARAHEPPYAHQAAPGQILSGMALAIEPGAYWEGGGGLRLEDVFLVGPDGGEALCGFPDDFRLSGASTS